MIEQPSQALGDFLKNYLTKRYQKGEIVIFQGEAPRATYFVKSGIIKAYNLSASGDEKPVGFYTANEFFPYHWTFYKAPSALYYYEALTDVELLHVPRDDYIHFLKRHPAELYAQLERLVTDHLGSSMRLNALQHSRASDKLIYTLHYLALSHGKPISTEVVELTLDLTHQDFANLTGLTRETAATELNHLKSLGVISYAKNAPYRIKTRELNKVLNDPSMADIALKL